MRKTKTKNDSLWQAGTLLFAALWAVSYAVTWIAVIGVFNVFRTLIPMSGQQSTLIGVVGVTLIPALLQVPLVERLLKHRVRGWIPVAVLGAFITAFIFTSDGGASNLRFVLSALSLFLPIAIVQTVWLWRRVNAAWLWLLTGVVASLVFSVPLRSGGSNTVVVIAGLLYGIVQGVVMRYLWMQPKEDEKSKHEAAEDETIAQARLSRLQEEHKAAQPWESPDESLSLRKSESH